MATTEHKQEQKEKVLPFVGEYKWSEVSEALDPKPRGVEMANLHPDMWTDGGYIITRNEENHTRSYNIIYDKDYVAHYLLTRLYNPLNIARHNGEFNLPLRQEIIEYSDQYAQDSSKREKEEDLSRRASVLAAQNGITFEAAKALIVEHDNHLQEAIKKLAAQSSKK